MSVQERGCVRLPRGLFARMATFGLLPTWCLLAVAACLGSGGRNDNGALVAFGLVAAVVGAVVMKIEVVVCGDELSVGVGRLQRRLDLRRFVGCGEGAVTGLRGYTTVGVVFSDRRGNQISCPMSQYTSRRERSRWIEGISHAASLEPIEFQPRSGQSVAQSAWDKADDEARTEAALDADPSEAITTVHRARVGQWMVKVRPVGSAFQAVIIDTTDDSEVRCSEHPTLTEAQSTAIGYINHLTKAPDNDRGENSTE